MSVRSVGTSLTPAVVQDFKKVADFDITGASSAMSVSNIPQTHRDVKIIFHSLKSNTSSMIQPVFFFNNAYTNFSGQGEYRYGTTYYQYNSTYSNSMYTSPNAYSIAQNNWPDESTVEIIIYNYSSTTGRKAGFWRQMANGTSGYVAIASGTFFLNITAAITNVGLYMSPQIGAGARGRVYLMGAI